MRKDGKILLVEDYEDTATILKKIFEKENFLVEIALTGKEALEKCSSFRPEIIILDLNLPDIDGLDLVSRFREIDPEVGIIVLTAYAELENAIRSLREGVIDFISKPFDNQYLLHSVRRSIELRRLKERLTRTEKLRALGEMAAGIAHDFNNILSSIMGLISVIKMKTGNDITAYIDSLEKIVQDGKTIVERLRRFYREEKDIYRIPVKVTDLVNDVITMTKPKWSHEAFKKGISIEVEVIHEKETRVLVNPSDLREVLVNIIFNAIEAMPKGGKITVQTFQENDFSVIKISDTGIGMSADILDRIFEPFFTTKGQGTGLGLAISYRLIQNYGGDIEVYSEPGKGTSFIIKLPLIQNS